MVFTEKQSIPHSKIFGPILHQADFVSNPDSCYLWTELRAFVGLASFYVQALRTGFCGPLTTPTELTEEERDLCIHRGV